MTGVQTCALPISPYYIGKGKNKRAWYKVKEHIKVPKHSNQIVIMESNLSNIGALALEKRYIRWYGRKDLGTGILINMTDGGEDPPNHKGKKQSQETIEKRMLVHKGAKRSAETCANISASLKGKKMTPETRAKMSASRLAYLKKKSDIALAARTS